VRERRPLGGKIEGPWRLRRQAGPSQARHRPGARSVRRGKSACQKPAETSPAGPRRVCSVGMPDVTRILDALAGGDPRAADELLPVVYAELRRLAAQKLAHEKPGQTLDATALVHEAYLRLVGDERRGSSPPGWDHRGHFFAAAAEAMRRILVEKARRKRRLRHGGGRPRVELTDPPAPAPDENLLALDEALTRLAADDPAAARVVELRYFAGLGHEQVAAALGVTVYQARQKWTFARAWLRDALAAD